MIVMSSLDTFVKEKATDKALSTGSAVSIALSVSLFVDYQQPCLTPDNKPFL
jgi:hypothetical protein